MKTKLLAVVAVVSALLLGAPFASAQTSIDSTTLSSAVTAAQNTITLGSVTCTNCTFGQDVLIYVDLEAMRVTGQYGSTGFTSTTVPVRRGADGTSAVSHASGATVLLGPGSRFHGAGGSGLVAGDPPGGACTRASQQFLPWVNVRTGWVWTCDNVNWRVTVPYTLTSNSRAVSQSIRTPEGLWAALFRW